MAIVADTNTEQRVSRWSPSAWFRWCPTSMADLAEAERRILSHVWPYVETCFVKVGKGSKSIHTISLNRQSPATPLVLLHGMGSGVGLWAMNLEALSASRPVYAIDVLGFGRSSRPKFNSDAMLAEMEFVESVEEWREKMNLDKFVLLGHSLGGFIAASYALRYSQHLQHLILVDPWGFPERPTRADRRTPLPTWIKAVAKLLQPFNPFAALRLAGPWGPSLVERFRPDLIRKFSELHEDDSVAQYIYHCNAQTPSGEAAFKTLTIPHAWARYPMINRIWELDSSLPMTMIYGSRSWLDSGIGYEVKYIRSESYVDIHIVKGAGHHVYADAATLFNEIINKTCQLVDRWRENPDLLDAATNNMAERKLNQSFRERPSVGQNGEAGHGAAHDGASTSVSDEATEKEETQERETNKKHRNEETVRVETHYDNIINKTSVTTSISSQ